MNMRKQILVVLAAFALLLAPMSRAQVVDSPTRGVTVNVNINSSATLTGGGALVFVPATGLTNTVTFSAKWNVTSGTQANFYSWFSSTNALTAGSASVPSSAIAANITAPDQVVTADPCTHTYGAVTGPVAGASCASAMLASTGSGDWNVNTGAIGKTITLQLMFPAGTASLPAGNFTGTLNAMVWIP
jgi:hypothetical protein